ncbi:MAG: hypothetical protein HGB04_05780 [Chlorobiaceae bacterium]|nr:hypothetical protein [Chlorobiaceae bacterium]
MVSLAGSGGRLLKWRPQAATEEVELAGIDVLGEPGSGLFPPDAPAPAAAAAPPKPKEDIFDIGAILRLRTFLYLIAGTALLLFQIHNTLSIKELARQNEQLREQLRISTSIRTSQELKASELQSIHNISGYAQGLGLISSAVPPVDLEP